MKLAAALKLAEDAFGYPLLGNAAVERALKDRLADVEPDDMEQDLVDFILTVSSNDVCSQESATS